MRKRSLKTGLLLSAVALAALAIGASAPAVAAPKCLGNKVGLSGTSGGDTINGTKHADVIASKGGADKVKSKQGGDRVCSGGGADKVKSAEGGDKVKAGGGGDKVNSSDGKDKITAGGGNDKVTLGSGNDTVDGGNGDDNLDGGDGTDVVDGGPGVDTCVNAETVVNCENPPVKPALHYDDQVDWGFSEQADEHDVDNGDHVKTVLRIGNGITGQAGYTRSDVSPQGFIAGSATTLPFVTDADDDNIEVTPPFPVDFFGIRYDKLMVSTNGWVAFGSPALDYFTDFTPNQTAAQIGEFYRGVFPYWSDLSLEASTAPGDAQGTIDLVVTGDSFAIQWKDLGYCCNSGPQDRNFQVVFFSDGRIRYDYPGQNEAGGTNAVDELVALSGGTGLSGYTEVQREQQQVPAQSILFTPVAFETPVPTGPGTATTVLPAGSTLVPGETDGRCAQTVAPTGSAAGEVSCPTGSLGPGTQDAFTVTWTVPPDVPPTTEPPDMNLSARWVGTGFDLTDLDQLLLATH